MALAPKFAGQKLAAGVSPKTFSKKMFNTLYTSVLPTIKSKYSGKLALIFRQQIQPWHPSSTLVHEAGIAVLRLAPDRFWEFSEKLFEKQTEFFDVNVVNEVRNDTYRRLAKIAAEAGLQEKEVYGLLEVGDKPGEDGSLNIGNKVTDDVKVMVKVGRRLRIWIQGPETDPDGRR
ncbi:hypothetical protein H2199_001234 [Coniosporium tulheliwenetii]|uniref:Uncharacterized protein n=1 Tax=Coniosporium tulheliwenetii TaxID=3383036 RepID=A0ACC2ZLB1_9PEZI|nr:hypothetical protein H2199_001234 [Cladosporium sp. JES 115]